MIGRHVGPFTVLGHLGEGRRGKVHLAKHEVLNTWRAVRLASPQRTRPLIVHVVPETARGSQAAHAPRSAHRDALAGSRYQLGDKLGTGGMAEVYAGTMIGAEGFVRRVAIKRVLSSLAEIPAFAAMFIAEAQIASRLAHPNIVSVLDFTRDLDDRLVLVMEYVDGKDLASLLGTGPLSPSLAIFIVIEMLRALDYAHDLPDPDRGTCGVIHRDVSPQNLLLSYEGAVKLSDFGLAKVRGAGDYVRWEPVRGKPSYMSPEQMAGELLDGRADLYAVGVMLWEMLAHRPLFAGTAQEIMAQVMFRGIARPSRVRRGVPPDLETIAMTLLARDPQDRYASAALAIEALLQCSDVPRDGRGELAHLLAERFPTAAGARPPRRGSAPGLLASPPSPPSPPFGGPSTAPGSLSIDAGAGLVEDDAGQSETTIVTVDPDQTTTVKSRW